MKKTGSLVTNHCWTAVQGRFDAESGKRAAVGGIIASVNNCVKIAVDGYSLSGAMIIGKVADTLATLTNDNVNKISEYATSAPFDSNSGIFTGDDVKSINIGSPIQIQLDPTGGKEAFWLVSAAEFFQDSAICAAQIDANIAPTIGGAMAKATYG